MSLLDYQQKINIGLMSRKQFGPLEDNENPNKLKPETQLWFITHQINKQFLLLLHIRTLTRALSHCCKFHVLY